MSLDCYEVRICSLGVIELVRVVGKHAFTEKDEEVVVLFSANEN